MVQLSKYVLVDEDNVNRGANITAVGAINAQDVVIRNSAGEIIDTFGGGQQYTEGNVDPTITGTAIMWEDTGDTLRPVNSNLPLPVAQMYMTNEVCWTTTPLAAGASYLNDGSGSSKDGLWFPVDKSKISGIVYADVNGTLYIKTGDRIIRTISVIGGVAKTFCVENVAQRISIQYTNGSTAQTEFYLRIWAQPSGVGFDVEDGLGFTKVYGQQGQPLQQRGGTYDTLVQLRHEGTEIDPRNIRALTASDIVKLADNSGVDIGDVDVLSLPPLPSGTNTIGIVEILDQYFISDKDDDASPYYYGFLNKDGGWYIMRETVIAGGDTYRYVKGNSDYATNWTNRTTLTYSYFDAVF